MEGAAEGSSDLSRAMFDLRTMKVEAQSMKVGTAHCECLVRISGLCFVSLYDTATVTNNALPCVIPQKKLQEAHQKLGASAIKFGAAHLAVTTAMVGVGNHEEMKERRRADMR